MREGRSLTDALGPDADIPPPDQTVSQKHVDKGAKMTFVDGVSVHYIPSDQDSGPAAA